jgi:hypothetical protein
LVLKRQRAVDNPPPNSFYRMIKDSLGAGVRYVEFMTPWDDQQQQQQEQQEDEQEDAAAAGAADAAAEGGEGDGDRDEQQQEQQEGEQEAAAEGGSSQQQQQQQEEEGGEEELRFLLRFTAADAAKGALDSFSSGEAAAGADAGLIAGLPASLRVVEGEEEEAYYKRVSVTESVRGSWWV